MSMWYYTCADLEGRWVKSPLRSLKSWKKFKFTLYCKVTEKGQKFISDPLPPMKIFRFRACQRLYKKGDCFPSQTTLFDYLPHRLIQRKIVIINTRHISPPVAKLALKPGERVISAEGGHFSSLPSGTTWLSFFRDGWSILNDRWQELL